jgi:hypothetical protein
MGPPDPPLAETSPEEEDTGAGATGGKSLEKRQLHPLPPGLVELYGLLAVLFVLVPEWMAGGALLGLRLGREATDLPVASAAWRKLPELRLATLNLAELRQLARQEGIRGYGRLDRERLNKRLLQRLRVGAGTAKSL